MPFPPTAWEDWTPAEYQVGAPATSSHFERWFRNPVAMAQGADGAPVLSGGWRPWDSVANGDSEGLIYSAALDGNVAAVESPDMEDGYEYMMRLRSPEKTSSNAADFLVEARTDGGTLISLPALTVSSVTTTSPTGLVGCVTAHLPRILGRTFGFSSSIENATTNTVNSGVIHQRVLRSTATKIKNLRMSFSSFSFTGTTLIYFYRRPVRIFE